MLRAAFARFDVAPRLPGAGAAFEEISKYFHRFFSSHFSEDFCGNWTPLRPSLEPPPLRPSPGNHSL